MVVIPNVTLLAILAEMIDTGNPLETVDLRLFKSNTVPSPTLAWADFEEADFTGYVKATAIPWNVPYIDLAGNAVVQTECHQFIQTAITVGCTVYGWALTTGSAPVVLRAAELFAAPVGFTLTGRSIQISGRLPLASGAG